MVNEFWQDEALMSKSWAIRASDPTTPTLKVKGKSPHVDDEATVQTMNSEYEGKEILYPTIRMIDGELQKLKPDTAFDMAIEKGDYVEYATREEAENASKKLSEHIGKERKNWKEFTEDPKGSIEKKEKEHLEWQKNLPFGTPLDFYSAAKTSDKMPDVEKGIMHKPFESKAEIFGHDFRNYLEANRTSIPFMKIRDYFYPPEEE
jgi:hypothetical protein